MNDTQPKPPMASFGTGKHHPSCRDSDRDLVWHCNQCGSNESAADIEATLTQPKPTGEWTAQFVNDTATGAGILGEDWAQVIANTHNAALAARDSLWRDTWQRESMSLYDEIEDLRKQLAAELALRKQSEHELTSALDSRTDELTAERGLTEQIERDTMGKIIDELAEERRLHGLTKQSLEETRDLIQQLRTQLDAEREKDELHAVALQVIERHHQKQLAAAQQPLEATIRELLDILRLTKDALNKVGYFTPIIDSALEQFQSYPLPDGRTK